MAKTVLLVFWLQPTQAASSPALQQPPDPQVQALTLLGAMDSSPVPSVVHTLPDALDVCVEALQDAHSPWCFWFGLDAPYTLEGAPGSRVERRLELLLQENSPNCPRVSFSFWENPPPQSCCSIQGRACPLTQPTSPATLGTVWVRAPHGPTLNSPQPVPTVCVCLPFRPYSPPCDFNQPGLSWYCSILVWLGRKPLTGLFSRSPVAGPVGAGLGL